MGNIFVALKKNTNLGMFFHRNKQNAFEKQIELNKKIQHAVNTLMASRLSFMAPENTSNALQRLLNELQYNLCNFVKGYN